MLTSDFDGICKCGRPSRSIDFHVCPACHAHAVRAAEAAACQRVAERRPRRLAAGVGPQDAALVDRIYAAVCGVRTWTPSMGVEQAERPRLCA